VCASLGWGRRKGAYIQDNVSARDVILDLTLLGRSRDADWRRERLEVINCGWRDVKVVKEFNMKENVPITLLVIGAIIVACPLALLANRIEEQYKHASELLWAGQLKEAQGELEAILRKKPNYRSAKVLLGLTLVKLSDQSEKKADLAGAVSQLREALRLDPEEAYWHSALARLLDAQGSGEEAAKECQLAARLSPDDTDLARGCGLGASLTIGKDITVPNVSGLVGTDGLTRPVPESHPAPAYSEKARGVRLQGEVVLRLIVGAHGEVEQAAVEKPLGLGLDESALRTVRTWMFKPATLNGAPTRVRVTVEMSFRLF
jgi:TonB family protein